MNALTEFQWVLVIVGAGIVLSVLFTTAWVMALTGRRTRHLLGKIEKLDATIEVLTSGSVGMGKKLLVLEGKLLKLGATQDEMQQSDFTFSYTQAQKLIAQGIDNQAIAANSGLSTTEINLMRLLQNQARGEANALNNHV